VSQAEAGPMSLVVHGSGPSPAALASVIHRLDPDLPVYDALTMTSMIGESVGRQRAATSMLTILGGLALLLSALGIYGVASHAVSERTREIGIRMSLGAGARDVVLMFVRQSLIRASIGIAIGLAACGALSTLLASFLFGLTPTDAATCAAGAFVIATTVAAASWMPARRAARIDPVRALKAE
jgi:ABC-type antimicrobial peptide transport system permease subunit